MPTLEEMLVKIDASTELLRKELNKGEKAVSSFESSVDRKIANVENRFGKLGAGLRNALGVLGVGFVGAAAVRRIGELATRLEDVARQAEALGATTDSIQELNRTFLEFGLAQEDVADALGTVADRAQDAKDGTKSFIDDFALLGVEVDELRDKRPDELLALIADGAASIEDPTRRTAAVVRIFGDDLGRRLNPLLKQGSDGLEEYAQRWHEAGLIIDQEGVESGRRAAEMFKRTGENVSALTDRLLLELLPAINKVAVNWNHLFFSDGPTLEEQLAKAQGELQRLRRVFGDRSQMTDFVRGEFDALQAESQRLIGAIRERDKGQLALPRAQTAPPSPFPITDLPPATGFPTPVTVRLGGESDAQPPVSLEDIRRVNDAVAFLEEQALRSQGRMAEAIRASADAQIAEWSRVAEETPQFAAQAAEAIRLINEKAAAQIEDVLNQADPAIQQFANNFAAAFESRGIDALLKGDISEAIRGLSADVAELVLRLIVLRPLASSLAGLFTGRGGGLSPITVPAFTPMGAISHAAGGPVEAGQPYFVHKDEMIIPDMPGRIISAAQMNRMGGGGDTVINNHVEAGLPPQWHAQLFTAAQLSAAAAEESLAKKLGGRR